MAIKISEAGFLSLLQDRGRFGHHRIGLTTGGAMDQNAYRICNKLLGNPEDTAVIEVTLGGLVVTATADHLICVTGAPVELKINDETLPLWSCHQLKSGDTLSLKAGDVGLRSYLGVAKGFQINSSFDSASTVVREKTGGLNGEKLAVGDILKCEDAESNFKMRFTIDCALNWKRLTKKFSLSAERNIKISSSVSAPPVTNLIISKTITYP